MYNKQRIIWLDIAKAYGMILVFYGHIIEQVANLAGNNVVPSLLFKFIYSFHMPLFFILCGYVSKSNMNDLKFKNFIKNKLLTRVVPFLFFNIVSAFILFVDEHNLVKLISSIKQFPKLILGLPAFNNVTWFIACLFTIEIINFVMSRYIKTNKSILILSILFFAFGYAINYYHNISNNVLMKISDIWYIRHAIIGYSLFLFGMLLKRLNVIETIKGIKNHIIIIVISLIFVLFTFNINIGHFIEGKYVVGMALGSIGQPMYFLSTALAGSIFIIYLSKITANNKVLLFIGQNSIVYLGVNGFIFPYNHKIAEILMSLTHSFNISAFLLSIIITIIQLIICIPITKILTKYTPLLIGSKKNTNAQ